MAFVVGGKPRSFKGIGKSMEKYMLEEAKTGVIRPLKGAVKSTPDEQALLCYMSGTEYGVSQHEALKEMEDMYGQKFDAKSLLERLEVFYEKALRGEVIVAYGSGVDELRQHMDILYRRVNK